MSTDNRFDRGSKGSSSIMTEEITPLQVQKFMETSFYLPVDVLKNRDWHVYPITVMTGEKFRKFHGFATKSTFHCMEDKELLFAAQFVAVSSRRRAYQNSFCHVAKIWYGKEPQS